MSTYTQKVKASLLAAALGDALGSFGECLHYKAVDREYPTLPPKEFNGRILYSDDTALRLVLYDTILSSNVNAFAFAEQWSRNVLDNRVYWISELYVASMISTGEDPHRIGHGNLLGDNAAMAADPIGALYPCFDELAALRAFETMSLCQSGKGLEGAMAVAAAVSRAMSPESTTDDVVDAAGRWVSKGLKRKIEDAVAIASNDGDPRGRLYDESLVEDGLTALIQNEINSPIPLESAKRLRNLSLGSGDVSMSISPFEVVPIAIGYVTRGKNDPLKSIREAASFGRDCDTIAGIAGAILGSLHGMEGIPVSSLDLLPSELVTKADQIATGMSEKARHVTEFGKIAGLTKDLF